MNPLLASLLKLVLILKTQDHIFCGERWSTMNCVWTLVHLHVSRESSKPLVESVCVLTSITFSVIWSSVLISVTWVWRYCRLVYKFFRINSIELKCSFDRCRKYHKSWWNSAAEFHIAVEFFWFTRSHWCMRQQSHTFSKHNFGRFKKHRSIVDHQETLEICTRSLKDK